MSKKFSFWVDPEEDKKNELKKTQEQLKKEFKHPESSERRSINIWKSGIQKYKLTLEGEMQVNSMNVKNTVENKFILQIKEKNSEGVLLDLVSYDKEMIRCSNPTFKEMFTVTRQFEKLYDEFTARVSLDGKVREVKNLAALQDKWIRIKNEAVQYFNEDTDIEQFFGLNEDTMKSQDIWIKLLNEQEFFFLFFNLAGYGYSFNSSKTIDKDNAYRSNTIRWNIQSRTVQEYNTHAKDIVQKMTGAFSPSSEWLNKAYGKMPFLTGITFNESFKLHGEYRFDSHTGFIKNASVYWEEVAHPAVLYHTMKFTLTQIL